MAEYNLGRVAFVDKGAYSAEETYNKWDFVTTEDSTYLFIGLDPQIGKPVTDTSFWKCIADGKPATLAAAAAILAKEAANSAATLANTKAGLANDAAILATEKAALADSKATLANDKAILAQSAADNANAKAAEVTAAILSAGSLGPIKPTDAAPTPQRNGNYTFSIGGNKPAWLTAEAGVTTVKAGDGVAVVYTAPSSYAYTHVDMNSQTLQKTAQTLTTEEQLQVRKNIGVAPIPLTSNSNFIEFYAVSGFDNTESYYVDYLTFDDASFGTWIRIKKTSDNSQLSGDALTKITELPNFVFHYLKNGIEFYFKVIAKTEISSGSYTLNNAVIYDLSINKSIEAVIYPNGKTTYNFKDYDYYALGDSITHGFNDTPQDGQNPVGFSGASGQGYAERFYKICGFANFIKLGYTGSTCKYKSTRHRLSDEVVLIPTSDNRKKLITVMIGTNDILESYDTEASFISDMSNLQNLFNKTLEQVVDTNSFVEAYYYNMLRLVTQHKNDLIVAICPPSGFAYSRMQNVINMQKSVCKQLGIPYVEIDAYFTTSNSFNDGYVSVDGLHPSPEIHKLMARALLAKLSSYFINYTR